MVVGRATGATVRRSAEMLPEASGAHDAVGDVVDGRYLLQRRAGAGAAGTVWVAHDLVRRIDVAVKLLRAMHLEARAVLAHFAREAELAQRMLSPHIVRVLATGSTSSHGPYVVYEYLEGEDLGRVLARRGRLAVAETRTIVVHACRALTRAHAIGVLHRDVKPSNLFLATNAEGGGVVKALDFGLAGVAGSDEEGAQALVGTLEYIAPEILFGTSAADARSDLYALAVVAYECLTGRVPYEAETVGGLVAAYAAGPAPVPSRLRPGLPPEIDAWFARALARDPAARFGTAKELADALDAAVASMDHTIAVGAPGASGADLPSPRVQPTRSAIRPRVAVPPRSDP